MIFDSHAHYDDKVFNDDREETLDKIKKANISRVLNCAADLNSCYSTLELTKKYDFIYGTIGIHPHDAKEALENLNKIGDLAQNKKIQAIGEIGLDYYYEGYDRDIQIKAFREQMDIAKQMNLPVVIHDRDAHEDTLNVLKEFKGVNGVLHCYSGSVDFAKEILKLDYSLGFTGVVTFNNAKKAIEVVKYTPMDRILIETDCPYMAPVPYRGKRNDSSYLVYVLEKIAEIKEIDYLAACKSTFENASKLFNII